MIFKGPVQPKTFGDSMILSGARALQYYLAAEENTLCNCTWLKDCVDVLIFG